MRSALAMVGTAATKHLQRYVAELGIARSYCDSSNENASPPGTKQNADEDTLGQMCAVISSAGIRDSPRKRRPRPSGFRRTQALTCSSPTARADARFILEVFQSRAVETEIEQVLSRYSFQLSDELVSRVVLSAANVVTAKSFFNWARNHGNYRPNLQAYNAYLQVLVKNGEIDEAVESFRQLGAPNFLTHGVLIEGLASDLRVDEALEAFEGVRAMGNEDEIRVCSIFFIRGLCNSGNVSGAFVQYEKLRESIRLEASVYNGLISGMVNNVRIDQALEVRRHMDDDFVKPNEHTYRALIFGLSNAERVDEACGLLGEMRSKGYRPEPAMYTTALHGLCLSRDFPRVFALVEGMEVPDVVMYTSLLDRLCDIGKLDVAFDMVDQIMERGNKPDTVFYSVLIKGLCRADQIDDALILMERMSEKGCLPNTVTYNTVIQGFISKERLVEARDLYEEMIRKGCEPNESTYMIISDGFIKKWGFDPADHLMEDARNERDVLDMASYLFFISKMCFEDEMEEAYRAFEQLCVTMSKPPVAAGSAIVCGFLRRGDLMRADKVVREMFSSGSVPDLRCIVSGLYHLADASSSKLPGAVLQMINQQEWIPHPIFCCCLVEAYCVAGLLDMACEFAMEVTKTKSKLLDHMWEVLIRRLCRFRKPKQALEVVERAVERGCKVYFATHENVIRVLLDADMLREAADQFKALVELEKCPSWLLVLTHDGLMSKLCPKDVTLGYKSMQELVRRGVSPSVRSYNRLIKGCCREGLFDRVRELFRQMKAVNSRPNVATYTILVDEYIKGGKLDDAFGVYLEMVEHGFSPMYRMYNYLVMSLCNAGRLDEAHQVLQELLKRGREPPLVTFEALFEGYYDSHRFDKAWEVYQVMSKVFRLTSNSPDDFHLKSEQLKAMKKIDRFLQLVSS